MILLLDNYDSFVYNLERYLIQLGQETLVARSDAMTMESIVKLDCSAIIISPGPKTPDDAGCSMEVVRRLSHRIPILGVCLGHQAIGQALGATVIRAPRPMHGLASRVTHTHSKLFEGIPETFEAGRYHSLILDRATIPDELKVTATTDDGLVMAVEHAERPLVGVQFHPESILTQWGYRLLANFLRIAEVPSILEVAE
ncbi:MAG: aminodeoxychorismate/anthranilate synthase component II [Pirellulales bacterium]